MVGRRPFWQELLSHFATTLAVELVERVAGLLAERILPSAGPADCDDDDDYDDDCDDDDSDDCEE